MVIENKPCAVIGGGEVAARKVRGLLRAGAKVTAVAPEFCERMEETAKDKDVILVRREYRYGDLEGMTVAIIATDDPDLNEMAAEDAREEGILVNVADMPDECDFTLPAVVQRGELTVAIGTGGQSPALARALREKIEKELGPEYGELAGILGILRKRFETSELNPAEKRSVYKKIIDSDLIAMLRRKDYQSAKKLVLELTGEEITLPPENRK